MTMNLTQTEIAARSHRRTVRFFWCLLIASNRARLNRLLSSRSAKDVEQQLMSLIGVACPHWLLRRIGPAVGGHGWAHFGHTWCPQRSILVNHNRCHFAAQCRFGSATST